MTQTLLKNAKIYRCNGNTNIADSMLWEDGMIKEVGSYDQVCQSKTAECTEIDLEGQFVMPAFHDSHLHLIGYSESLTMVDLYSIRSVEQLQERVRTFLNDSGNRFHTDTMGTYRFLCGRGWNQDYFEDHKMPTKVDLDEISKEIPIVLTRACGHLLVVNSKALEICAVTKEMAHASNGEIGMDEQGELNGIFREHSMSLITSNIPEKTVEELKQLILVGQERLFQQGITSVQSDDFFDKQFDSVIQAFRELEAEGKLKLHVYEQANLGSVSELKRYISLGLHETQEGNYYRLGPLKILGDGSLGARTAYMSNCYEDAKNTKGIAYFTESELYEYMKLAHDHNMQIAIHCIGDGMLDLALDTFERIQSENPKEDMRHGIVHCQITSLQQLQRIRDNELLVYMQPIFLNYDMHIVEQRVGATLSATSYNWKSLIDLGVHCSIGSDCPVEAFDPMNNIYSAVTRKDLQGYPDQGFHREQCLTMEQTLRAYTIESAYAARAEIVVGILEPGMRADVIVLSKDLSTCSEQEIRNTEIMLTFSEGELVYSKENN